MKDSFAVFSEIEGFDEALVKAEAEFALDMAFPDVAKFEEGLSSEEKARVEAAIGKRPSLKDHREYRRAQLKGKLMFIALYSVIALLCYFFVDSGWGVAIGVAAVLSIFYFFKFVFESSFLTLIPAIGCVVGVFFLCEDGKFLWSIVSIVALIIFGVLFKSIAKHWGKDRFDADLKKYEKELPEQKKIIYNSRISNLRAEKAECEARLLNGTSKKNYLRDLRIDTYRSLGMADTKAALDNALANEKQLYSKYDECLRQLGFVVKNTQKLNDLWFKNMGV